MFKNGIIGLLPFILFGCFVLLRNTFYTVGEQEQVIITQFGKPVEEPIDKPGLHFKKPFIQDVNRFDKRILEWDGRAGQMPTKDKTYIDVDTFARWRIANPLLYFQVLRDERSAKSRLDDILGSATRGVIAKHELIEVVRTTKDRVPLSTDLVEGMENSTIGKLYPIRIGRAALEAEIERIAKPTLATYGIELLNVRFKRVNYNASVQENIYNRMISERKQIAERFRSEGDGEAAKIDGSRQRELKKIESEAYKKVQIVRGQADAKATEIYATAYNQSPQAVKFYEFLKTMETYRKSLETDSTVILSTESDFFKYLKSMD